MQSTQQQEQGRPTLGAMQRAMGAGAGEDIIREALERVDGAPTPNVGTMQASMGRESRVRSAQAVIRAYLDEHGLHDTRSWAKRLAERAQRESDRAVEAR
ncbi:hypothetical protein [Leucobacter sp.]